MSFHIALDEALKTWPEKAACRKTPSAVERVCFGRDGILATRWFRQSGQSEDMAEQLGNKKEALLNLFYGKSTTHKNTFMTNGYSILLQYTEWCLKTDRTVAMDSDAKAKYFLEYRIDLAKKEWRRRRDAGRKGIAENETYAAFHSFKNAVCFLSALSFWQGYDLDLIYMENVKSLRSGILQAYKIEKNNYIDIAATSSFLSKRLDDHELHSVVESIWKGTVSESYKTSQGKLHAQMKSLVAFLLNHSTGRRGGDIRNIYLRMFMMHTLKDVRPVQCQVVGVSLRTVKEDNLLEDKEHLIGFIRHRQPLLCPVSALAVYLVWINDLSGQCFLEIMKKDLADADERLTAGQPAAKLPTPQWYHMPLIQGRKTHTKMSQTTHQKITHLSFDSGNISNKKSVTHIHRPTALANLLESGVQAYDAAMYQGWSLGVMTDVYAKSSFKTIPMLKAHGWENHLKSYECWREGSADLPASLAGVVFPQLDAVRELAAHVYKTHGYDRSALEFCKVLTYLRRVFIEDSMSLQSQFPDFPVYAHPLLKNSLLRAELETFSKDERANAHQREKQWRFRMQHPDVTAAFMDEFKKINEIHSILTTVPKGVDAPVALVPKNILKNDDAHKIQIHDIRVPEMFEPNPNDVCVTYAKWTVSTFDGYSYRDIYRAYSRFAWSKWFDKDKVVAIKNRYYKMKPFLDAIDDMDNDKAFKVLNALNGIMRLMNVDGAVFVKQCIYHYFHPPKNVASLSFDYALFCQRVQEVL